MIKINKANNVPKKFSSVISALESIDSSIATSLFYIVGSGVLNVDELDASSFSFTPTISSGKFSVVGKYVNTKDLILSFEGKESAIISRLKAGKTTGLNIPFDERNNPGGDLVNSVKLPLTSTSATSVVNYSNDYFSVLYVNGTPQRIQNINASVSESETHINVSFTKLSGGGYYPAPFDKDGRFTSIPFTGNTLTNWYANFLYTNNENEQFLSLKFENINIASSPRALILEVSSPGNIKHLFVPKDVADPETKLFYRIDENDPQIIYIKVSNTYLSSLANSTNLKIYFAAPLEELNPLSKNTTFSKKYKLPYKNIVENAPNHLKILSIDSTTRNVVDITALDSAIVGSVYALDYDEGTLELFNVFSGVVTESSVVYLASIEYKPPLQINYLGDIANLVTAYSENGYTYTKDTSLGIPTLLHVYAALYGNKSNFVTILDEGAYLQTANQTEEAEVRLIISENGSLDSNYSGMFGTKYIKVGSLSVSTSPTLSVTFTQNSSLVGPFQRLQDIAASITIRDRFDVHKIRYNNPSISLSPSSSTYYVVVPITTITKVMPLPNFLQLYGYSGHIIVRNTNTATILSNVNAKIGIVPASTPPTHMFSVIPAPLSGTTYIHTLTKNSSFSTFFDNHNGMYNVSPLTLTEAAINNSVSGPNLVYLEIEIPATNITVSIDVMLDIYMKVILTV